MSPRRWALLFAGAGALPSLVWAVTGPGLLHDDWTLVADIHFAGVWESLRYRAFVVPARPVAGAYYTLVYGLFRNDPVPHAVALAALNAAAGALVFLVADRLWERRVAIAVALAWVVLPNRSASRLWFSAGITVLALVLLLLGILALLDNRTVLGAGLLVASVLTYESSIVVALAAVILWYRRTRPRGRPAAVLAAGGLLAAGLFVWLSSPKRGAGPHVLAHLNQWTAAQLGAGLFGSGLPAVAGGLLLLTVVAVASGRRLLPGFRSTSSDGVVTSGAEILLLGAAPFLAVGFPVATNGIFDRANVIPDLGTAVIIGGTLAALATSRLRLAVVPLAAFLVVYPGLLNWRSLADYRRAVRQGEQLQAHLAVDVPSFHEPLVIGPPLPARGGIAQFIADWDTGAYVRLVRHDSRLQARMALTRRDFDRATEPLRYDRVRRLLERPSGPAP